MSNEITLKRIDGMGNMEDVFLDGGHIGRVGKQKRAKGHPPDTYFYLSGKDEQTAIGQLESQTGWTSKYWAAEALTRIQPGHEQFHIYHPGDCLAEMVDPTWSRDHHGLTREVTIGGQVFAVLSRLERKQLSPEEMGW